MKILLKLFEKIQNRYTFVNCSQVLNSSQSGQFLEVNNTINQTIPLFLRGGYIVSQASSTDTSSTITNNNLILHIGFPEKNSSDYFVSEGKILGLTDIYNDTALYQSCFVGKCLVTVKAEATIVVTNIQTHYEIKMSFSGDLADGAVIYINSAQFYGLNSQKCVAFNLGTTYQLKVQNSVTMNIYE